MSDEHVMKYNYFLIIRELHWSSICKGFQRNMVVKTLKVCWGQLSRRHTCWDQIGFYCSICNIYPFNDIFKALNKPIT